MVLVGRREGERERARESSLGNSKALFDLLHVFLRS